MGKGKLVHLTSTEEGATTTEDKCVNDYSWIPFYEELATKLLAYQNDRSDLIGWIHTLSEKTGKVKLNDKFADGSRELLTDICPFTAMGIFNRGITVKNRILIATEFKEFLQLEQSVPSEFPGIPVLNNQKSWYFRYHGSRGENDIDTLWAVFSKGIEYSSTQNDITRHAFLKAYDEAIAIPGVKWNLSMGLYWIRPWFYPTLDSLSRPYIREITTAVIGNDGPGGQCSGSDYLSLRDRLNECVLNEECVVHSFPELTHAAWLKNNSDSEAADDTEEKSESNRVAESSKAGELDSQEVSPYSIKDIIADGCFISEDKLETMLQRLDDKKNIILQGPPGTGKTWLARRLACSLIGSRAETNVRSIQFHPNMSYEDFVRGWRPSGNGKLSLVDGPFMEMIEAAKLDLSNQHVLVIEEINRGNPAQILGEMLTLLERDKRSPENALELSYRRSDRERVYIPENLYVIGTMNLADRSLALVDLALRRRFAFIDLEPSLNSVWSQWLLSEAKIDASFIGEIQQRLEYVNSEIMADKELGAQYCVGHSYVTPAPKQVIDNPKEWFRQVVETEIGPLLDEYWLDSSEKSQSARKRLLEGL